MENREKIAELYKKYNLTAEDVYKHKHYLIITRSGIEKIMASGTDQSMIAAPVSGPNQL